MNRSPHDDSTRDFLGDEDPDAPQPCDLTPDDTDYDTVACPHCGAEISELAEQCPSCGDWIISGGATNRRRPVFVIVALLLIILVLLWVL